MAMLDPGYLSMHARLFDDLVDMLPEYSAKEAKVDSAELIRRAEAEGFSFLSKTLPALGKHFESALESGTFHPHPSFKTEPGRATPCFMRGLFKGVFDEQGLLRETPCATSIRGIRQVLYFQYKLEVEYDRDLVDECLQEFVNTDDTLTHCESLDREQELILKVASYVVRRIFGDFDHRDIQPRPGPGASADGTHRVYRFEPVTKYEAIHEVYPYYSYFYTGTEHLLDRVRAYRSLPRKQWGTSVVRLVPKDSRGPRIICMEPQEYMFLQQGLGGAVREQLRRHPLSRGRVNFDDQSINRRLALESSISGRYSTLDMKEASDRISKCLVEHVFAQTPELLKALMALRSPRVRLPSGEERDHRKFAPMGSSLCFPVMSTVHYALGLACIHVKTGIPIPALAKNNSLYVYGDDLIVKSEYVDHLFEGFPKFGLKFNPTKSFVRGRFRESCGMDAFNGECVTPLRLKQRILDTFNTKKKRHNFDLPLFLAAADFAYNLESKGWRTTAQVLKATITERFGSFPTVMFGSGIVGWRTSSAAAIDVSMLRHVFHRPTHSWRLQANVVNVCPDSSMVGSWERLVKSLILSPEDSARVDGRFNRVIMRQKRVPVQTAYATVKRIPGLAGT